MNGDFFHFEWIDDVLVITLRCDVGSFAADLMGQDLHEIDHELSEVGVPRVVIDFRQRAYFGSALLEALLHIWGHVRDGHGRMALYNVSPIGRELLGLARFRSLWPICSSQEEAISSVHAENPTNSIP